MVHSTLYKWVIGKLATAVNCTSERSWQPTCTVRIHVRVEGLCCAWYGCSAWGTDTETLPHRPHLEGGDQADRADICFKGWYGAVWRSSWRVALPARRVRCSRGTQALL